MSLERRGGTAAGAVALMLLGTGCYHAGKDALARSAQADFREAHVGASLDDELKHSKEMLGSELTATRRSVEARRDEAVARLLDLRWGGAPEKPADRCPVTGGEKLAGNTPQCAVNMLLQRVGGLASTDDLPEKALEDVNQARSAVEAYEPVVDLDERHLNLRLGGKGTVSCPEDGKPDPSAVRDRPELQEQFDRFARDCATLSAARKAARIESGRLGRIAEEWRQEKGRVDAARDEAAALERAYDDARKAYDQAVAERTKRRDQLKGTAGDLKSYDEKVSDAAGKAKTALDDLEKAGFASGAVRNVFAAVQDQRARYAGVVDALGRIANGEPKSDSGIEIVLSTTLRLGEIQGATGLPRLLLEAERLRGRLALLQVRADHAERRVALLEAERTALASEFDDLMSASKGLADAREACAGSWQKGADIDAATVFQVLERAGPGKCREHLATALVRYANAYSIGELRASLAATKVVGDHHDEAIEVAAEALRMWDTALAIPIDGVVARHASGVRPEELAKLIVGAIGAGALVGIAVK